MNKNEQGKKISPHYLKKILVAVHSKKWLAILHTN